MVTTVVKSTPKTQLRIRPLDRCSFDRRDRHEAVSLMTTLVDHVTDMTTRAEDQWARLPLLLWSHRSGSQSILQAGKLFEVPAALRVGETQLLEGGKAVARENSEEGGHRPDDGKADKTRAPTLEQMNEQSNPPHRRAR